MHEEDGLSAVRIKLGVATIDEDEVTKCATGTAKYGKAIVTIGKETLTEVNLTRAYGDGVKVPEPARKTRVVPITENTTTVLSRETAQRRPETRLYREPMLRQIPM